MAIREIITANCENGQLSKSKIARQWDDQGTLIQFAGYPEPETDEELIFRLIVWMRASEDTEPVELPPIELEADQWLISNYYTQLPQMLRFQLCITNGDETYEKHSPIFSGIVDKSLSHNGEGADIDVIPLFDPYKKYVDELILDAGARVVDTELDETSTHLVENKAVASAVADVNGRLTELNVNLGFAESECFIPVGYKSANYENSAGTLKFKYENEKLVIRRAVKTAGDYGFGETTYGSAGIALTTDIAYDLSDKHKPYLHYSYVDSFTAFTDGQSPSILLRFYNSDLTSSVNKEVIMDKASDSVSLDLLQFASDNGVDILTRPFVVIRGLSFHSGTASGPEEIVLTIDGFTDSNQSIVDKVENTIADLVAERSRAMSAENALSARIDDVVVPEITVDSELNSASVNPVQNKAIAAPINKITNDVTRLKTDLGFIESECVIPVGYTVANYENTSRAFKYENEKLTIRMSFTSAGEHSYGEIAYSSASIALTTDIAYDLSDKHRPLLCFSYTNTLTTEEPPGLLLRFCKTDLTSAVGVKYLFDGTGDVVSLDLLQFASDNGVDILTRPLVVIRSLTYRSGTASGPEEVIVEIDGFTDSNQSIVDKVENTITDLATERNRALSAENALSDRIDDISSPVGTDNPFRFKPCWYHFFLNTVQDEHIYVPSQSPYDVQIAHRLGFSVYEINTHVLSDGVFICLHGADGKFGLEFESADPNVDVQNTVITSVDYEWVKTYVRYKADKPRLRTPPPTLSELLKECKKYSIIPFLGYKHIDQVDIANDIMGKDNYIMYEGTKAVRQRSNCMIATFLNRRTKEDILNWADSVGPPFLVGHQHPENFTDEEWIDIVHSIHERGGLFCLSGSPAERIKGLADFHMDALGSYHVLNPTNYGNLQNLESSIDFSDFIVVNGTENNGQLVMQNGGTVKPRTEMPAYFLTGMWIEVTFVGDISIAMGRFVTHANCRITSTESKTIWYSTYGNNVVPTFELKANSNDTVIENLLFKTSRF